MSKLLGLREWLTIGQTVRYAETILGETVNAKELIQTLYESGEVCFSFLPEGKRWYWCKPINPEDHRFPVETALTDDIDREGCLSSASHEFMPMHPVDRYMILGRQSSHANSIIWLMGSVETRETSPVYSLTILEHDIAGTGPRDAVYAAKWGALFDSGFRDYSESFYVDRLDLEKFLRDERANLRQDGPCLSSGDSPRPPLSNKSAETRIANTQLVIIAALCRKLGIDPNERGAATRISDMTALVGAKIDSETIGKYLKKINDVIDVRSGV